jgi:uracil-DNA glycosylase
MYVAKACAGSFLEQEIRDCNPRVMLTFGQQAEQVVGDLFRFKLGERPEGYDQSYEVEVNGSTMMKIVRRSGSIIAAPHPSTVGRFAKKSSWISSILQAYTDAQKFERPLTVVEGEAPTRMGT